MKVVIGTPSNDLVHTDFCMSLVTLTAYTITQKNIQLLAVTNQKNCVIAQGRCTIVETAQNLGAEALLFIDSDQTFPKETLTRLVSRGKNIIGCNIIQRRSPFKSNTEDFKGNRINEIRNGVEEVLRIGTGVIFIKMSVFENIDKPYFNFGYNKEHGWFGEDFYFCKKARDAGFQIYCDHDLSQEIGHLGLMNYNIKMLKN